MISSLIQYLQKDLVKNFIIYIIGAVFLKGIAFFLLPLYTKLLTPQEFGQLELITTITTVLSILLSYGLPQLVFIEYFHINNGDKLRYLNTIISIYFLAATPAFIIFYIILLNYNFFDLNENKFYIISIALLSSYFLFFQTIFFSILQLEKQALKLTQYKVISGIGIAAFNILLVYYLRLGILGILFTNLIALILSLIIAFPKKRGKNQINISPKVWANNELLAKIKKGFPYIISSLSFWMIAGIDRWIILYYLDQYNVGIYSVAYKFAVVYEPLLIGPILGVYTPYIFERFKNQNLDQKPILITFVTILVFAVLAVVSYFTATLMVDKSFQESLFLVPILVFGFAFILLAQIFASLMVYFNKSNLLIKNVLISSMINIIANLIFIRFYGLVGAAIAFLVSNFGWYLLTYLLNIKIRKKMLLTSEPTFA